MAYITGSETYISNNASSYTVTIPPTAQNDVVLLVIACYSTASISSVVGDNAGTWTQEIDGSASADDIYVYSCAQAATPDTSVTVTFGAAEYAVFNAINVRGADTTTPVETSSHTYGFGGRDLTMPTVTPTTNKSLIFRVGGCRQYPVYPEAGGKIIGIGETQSSYIFYAASVETQITAALTSAQTFHHLTIYGGGTNYQNALTFSVKDDGNGNVEPGLDLSTTPYNYLLPMTRYDGGFIKGNWYDPTSVSYENISSLSNGSYTNSSLHALESSYSPGALKPGFRSVYSAVTSTYADNVILTGYPITETYNTSDDYDLSGALICVSNKSSDPRIHPDSDIGSCIAIGDQTNARFWQLPTTNSVPSLNDGTYPTVIDVDDSTFVMDDVGTPNTSTISSVIIGSEPTAYYVNVFFSPLWKLGELTSIGGSSTVPASFDTFSSNVTSNLLNTVLKQGGLATNQFIVAQDTKCGGSEVVYWDCSNQSVEWPGEYDADTKRRNFKMGAGVLTHTIAPATGSTVIYNSSTLNFGNLHNFTLNSPNVAISSDGLVVLNSNVTLTAHSGALSGISFIGCKEIVNSCDLSGGNTISNCVDTYAITVTSEAEFNDLQNCDFSGNNYSIRITGNHGGATWSATGMTVAGGTGSYDIRYEGTGTLTIEVEAGSGFSQGRSEATVGTLTISAPTITLTVNSDVASSDIKIFETGTQTIEASATGTTASTTTTGTYDITVMKAGYLPQRQTGVVLGLSNVTVDFSLVADPVYDSGHGLTYTTDFSYNRATKKLTLSTRREGRDFYSALIAAFIAQPSLYNTAFDFKAVGPDSIFFLDDAEIIDAASKDNWKGAGIRYLDSSDVVTAEWCSVKSAGTIPAGGQGEYQQVDGSGTTDLRATGAVDQIVQIYGDVTHGNFNYRGHLVIKYQINGYREARADVVDLAGVATLEPFEYSVALEPVAIAAATGDPAITLTVTDHGASPVTWNGKQFSLTVQYSGADSGEDIIRELNYNLSLDTTYQGKDPFNWPEMVLEAGSAYETLRGITEGGVGATLKGVRVVNAGGDPHPDFTRFQADDGTYYVVPVTANGSITNIVSGSRVRIYNETTATETYNDVPGTSYAVSYTDGTTYSNGDVIKIYITQTSGTTAKLPFTTTVVASSTGWSALADQEDDDVYNQYAIDGSGVTKFSADYVDDEVDLVVASNFSADEMYAWWAYNLTTSQGIADFFGGLTAQDAANLLINNSVVNIKLDNTTASNVYQTDNVRIYRADSAYPVKNPTTGGGGIDIVWRDRVYIAVTGSGVTAQDKTDIKNLVFDEVVEGTETFKEQVRLMRAEAAGKLSVSGSTVSIRDAADSKDRIVATVDENGQRTAVTTDAS